MAYDPVRGCAGHLGLLIRHAITIHDANDPKVRIAYWTIGRVAKLVILVVVHSGTDEEDEEVNSNSLSAQSTPRERTCSEEVNK